MSELKSSTVSEDHRYLPYPPPRSLKHAFAGSGTSVASSTAESSGSPASSSDHSSTTSASLQQHNVASSSAAGSSGSISSDATSTTSSQQHPGSDAIHELQIMRAQLAALLANNGKLSINGADPLIQNIGQRLSGSADILEEADVTIALQRDRIVALDEAFQEAIQQRDTIQANSRTLYTEATAAAESLQLHQDTIRQLESEREEILKTNRDRETEIQHLRQLLRRQESRNSQPTSSSASSASSSNPSVTNTPEGSPSSSSSQSSAASSSSASSTNATSQPEGLSPSDVSRIAAQVLSGLAAGGIPSSAQSTPSTPTPAASKKKRRGPPKPGSMVYTQKVIDDAFANSEYESDWRTLIRTTFLNRTGMSFVNDFKEYQPVAEATAQAYEECRGPGPGPEGITQNLLYFGDGWRTCRWNNDVITRFATEVIAQQEAYHIPGPCLPREAIEGCLLTCIKQAQASWKRDKPRLHAAGDRQETAEEAQNRAQIQEDQRHNKLRENSRKRQKYATRLKTLENLLKKSDLSALSRQKWEFVQDIIQSLGYDGQSSDNTDLNNDNLALVSTVPYYRRRIVGDLLHDVDIESTKQKQKIARYKGGRSASSPTKIRRRGTTRSHESVVRKLPRALYHRKYLDSLPPYELELLKVNDTVSMPMFNLPLFCQNSDSDMDEDGN